MLSVRYVNVPLCVGLPYKYMCLVIKYLRNNVTVYVTLMTLCVTNQEACHLTDWYRMGAKYLKVLGLCK